MRKAFTIIEVLVAVSILSIVALGLLQVQSNNIKLINRLTKQYAIKERFSIILMNADTSWDGKSPTLYEMLKTKFSIKDDDTIKKFKDIKIEYAQEEFSKIDLLDTDLEDVISDVGGIDKSELPEIKLLVDKVTMTSDESGASGYLVTLE